MMKNYNPYNEGIHTVRITLQDGEYVGHITHEVGGNCHGIDVLDYDFDCVDESDFDGKYASNDCNLQYNEEYDSFNVTLKNDAGDTLLLEDMSSHDMNNMIVGIEIVDFKEEIA